MVRAGFGLPGISGIVLLTVGMIAMEPSPLQALVLVLIIVLMLGAAFSVAMHSFEGAAEQIEAGAEAESPGSEGGE